MKRLLFLIESVGFPQYTDVYLGLDLSSVDCQRFIKWAHMATNQSLYPKDLSYIRTVTFPVHDGGQLYFLSKAFRESTLPNGESVQNCIKRNHYCTMTDRISVPLEEDVAVLFEVNIRDARIRFLIIPKTPGPVFRTKLMIPSEIFKD